MCRIYFVRIGGIITLCRCAEGKSDRICGVSYFIKEVANFVMYLFSVDLGRSVWSFAPAIIFRTSRMLVTPWLLQKSNLHLGNRGNPKVQRTKHSEGRWCMRMRQRLDHKNRMIDETGTLTLQPDIISTLCDKTDTDCRFHRP